MVEVLRQQCLGAGEYLFDPQSDGLGPVVAEASHPQVGQVPGATEAVEVVAQAAQQGMLALVAMDLHLVPAVEGDLIQRQHQVLAHTGIAQRVGAFGGHQDVQVAMVLQRVDADVDQQEDLIGHAWLQQALLADCLQGQGDALLQAAEQVEQLVLAQVAAAWVQGQACRTVDHAVAMSPGQQFEQLATALDRGEVFPLVNAKVAVVQAPVHLSGFFAVG
ncbi:hypothetical protein D3C77_401590 [compost metagenome]